jgi:predicted glycosyltransferase
LALHDTAGGGRAPLRVLFYVQHLLGTGHIHRAKLLAAAMIETDMDVHVIRGGMPGTEMPAGASLIQLPPLRAKDRTFSALVDESGAEPSPQWLERRRRCLLRRFRALRPDIVVIESFPFGRRKLRFELVPLLDEIQHTRPRPLVACSVRDIVQSRKPSRIQETVALLRTRFDHVMVHGDPNFIEFGESFPAVARIADRLHYTGYVAPRIRSSRSTAERNEVLVSGGGGAVSANLLTTAIEARCQSGLATTRWRILAGPNIAAGEFDALRARASDGVYVERNRSDFPELLRRCRVSVSQCGYNTAIDLIQSRARAVVVPFEGDGESEQRLRAAKLAERGLITVLSERDLAPASLAEAVDRCAVLPRPAAAHLDMDGAEASARFLLDAWRNAP